MYANTEVAGGKESLGAYSRPHGSWSVTLYADRIVRRCVPTDHAENARAGLVLRYVPINRPHDLRPEPAEKQQTQYDRETEFQNRGEPCSFRGRGHLLHGILPACNTGPSKPTDLATVGAAIEGQLAETEALCYPKSNIWGDHLMTMWTNNEQCHNYFFRLMPALR